MQQTRDKVPRCGQSLGRELLIANVRYITLFDA
jgi:hypothetical protein